MTTTYPSTTSSAVDVFAVLIKHTDIKSALNEFTEEEVKSIVYSNWTNHRESNIIMYLYSVYVNLPKKKNTLLDDIKFLVKEYDVNINIPDGNCWTLFRAILADEKEYSDEFYNYVIENSEFPTHDEVDAIIKKNSPEPVKYTKWHQTLVGRIDCARNRRGDMKLKRIIMPYMDDMSDDFYDFYTNHSDTITVEDIEKFIMDERCPCEYFKYNCWQNELLRELNDYKESLVDNTAGDSVFPVITKSMITECVKFLKCHGFLFTNDMIRYIIRNNIQTMFNSSDWNSKPVYYNNGSCSKMHTDSMIGDDVIYSSDYVCVYMCGNKHLGYSMKKSSLKSVIYMRCRDILLKLIKTIAHGDIHPNDLAPVVSAFDETHALLSSNNS